MRYDKQQDTGEFTVVLSLDIGQVTLDAKSVREFYFIEDIFSFCMTGKVIFTDDRGIFEFGPLTGNETISIIYGEEEDKEYSFYIYKLSRIDQTSQFDSGEKQAIEIFFAEKSFFMFNYLQFSKSWKDEKISNIVNDIAQNIIGITKWDKWEDTNEKLKHFYSPYWNPNTCLLWLSKRGTGAQSSQPGFCFYNTMRGGNFVTLEKLLRQKKRMTINDQDDGVYVFNDNDTRMYNKILSWSITGLDTVALKNLAGGTRWGFDSNTKKFLESEFNYKDAVQNHTILGEKTLFPDYSEPRSTHLNFGESSEDFMFNIFSNGWNKRYMHQQAIGVTVKGHEERYPGNIIELQWPSNDDQEVYNKNLSGFYLVKSITHYFSGYKKPAYTQKMVLLKNGYEDSDARSLVKAKKKNIVG